MNTELHHVPEVWHMARYRILDFGNSCRLGLTSQMCGDIKNRVLQAKVKFS